MEEIMMDGSAGKPLYLFHGRCGCFHERKETLPQIPWALSLVISVFDQKSYGLPLVAMASNLLARASNLIPMSLFQATIEIAFSPDSWAPRQRTHEKLGQATG